MYDCTLRTAYSGLRPYLRAGKQEGALLSNSPESQSTSYRTVWIILAVLFAVSLIKLGAWGVIDTSEARYAHIADNMYKTGDYVHPVYLGIEHYHKPPLTYQMTALVYELFGSSAFSARLLLQVALLLQIWLVYLIARQVLIDRKSAIHAALIYTSFPIIWIATRTLTTDAYLTTFILASILCVLRYLQYHKIKYLYLLGVFGALGFLTKITAYFVVMGPVTLALLWHYRDRRIWNWHIVPAVALFGLLCSTWFISLGEKGWEIFKYLMYEQSLVRYASDVFYRNQSWYFYLMLVPALSLPWIFYALFSVIKKDGRKKNELPWVFFLIWFIFPIVFYSLSKSKLILYVLPAFPGLALYCAAQLAKVDLARLNWLRIAGTVLGIVLMGGLAIYQLFDKTMVNGPLPMAIAGLGIVTILILHRILSKTLVTVAIPAVAMLFIAAVAPFVFDSNPHKITSADYLAEWIEENELQDSKIFVLDRLMPSLSFHTEKDVALIYDTRNIVQREIQFERDSDWTNHYYNLQIVADVERLKMHLQQPSIFIKRRGMPSERGRFLLDHFSHQENLGKWEVYY